ncbi:MAG: DUF2796 domain-containing protein [Pseudomonadota bacterium]
MTGKSLFISTALCAFAWPAIAEDKRELDAHVHGHGALNIAMEGNQVAIELEVPGFDIVGFEYEASTDEDKAAIATALDTLGDASNLFSLTADAGCEVTEASVELLGEEDEHGEHEGEDHAAADTGHDHGHSHGHAHGEAAHSEEAEAEHSEFHAEYLMTCAAIDKLASIELPYFENFPNAEELEVQLVTEQGASEMEASPDQAVLDVSPST